MDTRPERRGDPRPPATPEDAVNSRVQARHQLKGFLLRHDVRYTGKTSWSIAYYRWLSNSGSHAGAITPKDQVFRVTGVVTPAKPALFESERFRLGQRPFHLLRHVQGPRAGVGTERARGTGKGL